jgi:translation initiation factor IF-2
MADFDDWDDVAESLAETQQTMLKVAEEMKALEEQANREEAERIARLEAEERLRDVKVEKKMTVRQKELAEQRAKEEEERRKIAANTVRKSEFEEERDEFIADFIRRRKEADEKAGKKYKWIGKMNKMSEGEAAARDAALTAWKKEKGL